MPSPIVIHVLRPYASEEEYLAHESFTIDAKSMLLVEQPPLPADTAIIFDIALTNGQKPIRAEGRVLEHVAPDGNQPGGLRVRFKRFGAATKAVIDRAVAASPATSLVPGPALSLAPNASSFAPAATVAPEPPLASLASLAPEREANASSGVHRRTVGPVAAPADREALLARLRGRQAS